MSYSPAHLIEFLLAIVLLFALVIAIGLRFRARILAQNRQLNAQNVWASLPSPRWQFADLLFGVAQDFSPTESGLVVRDSQDRKVAEVIFHTGMRSPWLTLKLNDGAFEADVLPAMRQTIALHVSENPSHTACIFKRQTGGTYDFEIPGLDTIQSRPLRRLQLKPLYEFVQNDQVIGISQRLGGSIDRGNLLVLPSDISLPVRVFVLALQRQRM